MKSKSFFVLLLATFFSVIITSAPVFATTPSQQQSPAFATEQMPTWLAEAGAVPVPDAQLELVQGEGLWAAVTCGGWSAVYYVSGLVVRNALNLLAEKRGWNIRFTVFAPLTAYSY